MRTGILLGKKSPVQPDTLTADISFFESMQGALQIAIVQELSASV